MKKLMENLDEMVQAGRDVLARRANEAAEAEKQKRARIQALKEWAGTDVTIQVDKYIQNVALIRGDKAIVVGLKWDYAENRFEIRRPAVLYKLNLFDYEAPKVEHIVNEQPEVALAWLFEKE